MTDEEMKWGIPGSLIDKYMTDRHSLIRVMQKDGWDVSQTLEEQRKWIDGQPKKSKMKKTGVLLVHQLDGLIGHVRDLTKGWNKDKDKIKDLESEIREIENKDKIKDLEAKIGEIANEDMVKIKKLDTRIRELEKRNQALENNPQPYNLWRPSPPYTTSQEMLQQGSTAPPHGETEPGDDTEYEVAPVAIIGLAGRPVGHFHPMTPGERQQILNSLGTLQSRNANENFWMKLDTIWVGHQLHIRDKNIRT